MTDRLHVTIAVELDREALTAHRDDLLDKGEQLYTEEDFGSLGKITVKHWPGEPEEWASLADITDLVTVGGVITRTEVVKVTEGEKPWAAPKRSLWARLTRRSS